MTPMRLAALVLLIVGVIALVSPAVTFTTRDKVLDVGPIEVTKEERKSLPLMPILGVAAIVLAVGLFVTDKKRPA